MATRRWKTPPALNLSLRKSTDPSSYALVDAALKDLKICLRRLQFTHSTFRDDLQILQRLYYKGKNQHRYALFWKHTSELRKYGERLDGLGLLSILELTRCSFFGVTVVRK